MSSKITSNDALQLFQQNKDFLSTYISDQIVTTINQNISGVMDSCKQLFVFGTGQKDDGLAEIVVKYQSMNIPASTAISSMMELYTKNYNQINAIETYDYLSGHYSKLVFGQNQSTNIEYDNRYLTSDIIKLQFKQPVATYAKVLSLISAISGNTLTYLEKHHNWSQNNDTTQLPQWLNEMPHKNLFTMLSTKIQEDLNNHNIDIHAHEDLLQKYFLKTDVDQIKEQLLSSISYQQSRGQAAESQIKTRVDDVYNILSTAIKNHKKATNQPWNDYNLTLDPSVQYAHNQIFKKYDRSTTVNDKDNKVRAQVSARFKQHMASGRYQHIDLASKWNPYFQGNIYLNYIEDWDKRFTTNGGDDMNPHALIIRTSKNDLARFGSYLVSNQKDCGGLAIQTGDNGNQPIKVQQTMTSNYIPVNTAYLLDQNGNTSFPKKLTANTLQINSSANITDTITVGGKATLNNAQINYRSTINIHDLPSGDSSWQIPNTQWVHMTVSGLAKLFAVSGLIGVDDNEYYPLVPYDAKNSNFITQKFKYIKSIKLNPAKGSITGASFFGEYAKLTQIDSNNINSNYISANEQVISPWFTGTANKAKYDEEGILVNTKVQMNAVATDNVNYPILFSNGNYSGTKKHIKYNDMIWINPKNQTIHANFFEGHASSANWADLAEIYETDKEYLKGTLVQFGGQKQITVASTKINGVISDKPAYLMNSGGKGQPIALVGRVYVRVIGKINKFDYIGLSDIPGVGKFISKQFVNGAIGIALQSSDNINEKLVLCSIQLHI